MSKITKKGSQHLDEAVCFHVPYGNVVIGGGAKVLKMCSRNIVISIVQLHLVWVRAYSFCTFEEYLIFFMYSSIKADKQKQDGLSFQLAR